MARSYFKSVSAIYCFIIFIGGLGYNAGFLPSSKILLVQRSTTSLQRKQYKNKLCNNNNRSTNEYNKNNKSNTKTFSANKRRNNSNSKFNMYKNLNYQLIQCSDAFELLNLLGSHSDFAISKFGGGGDYNDVNFSTAIYRFATFLSQQVGRPQQRKLQSQIYSDPRFALLVCSIVEAWSKEVNYSLGFGSRTLSSIGWSIAKLNIAPPKEKYSVEASSKVFSKAIQQSAELRNKVKHQAATHQNENEFASSEVAPWVPELSNLCGSLVDMISYNVSHINDPFYFDFQQCSNLLWAAATTRRTDFKMMTSIVNKLVKLTEMYLETKNENKPSQEKQKKQKKELNSQVLSISLWSLATSSIFGPDEQLIQVTAKYMVLHSSFLEESKPQCLSNIVWSTATLLSKRPSSPSHDTNIAALTIMRCISKEVVKRQGTRFDPQCVSNIAWALATVGFGVEVSNTNNSYDIDSTSIQQIPPAVDTIMLDTNDQSGDYNLMSDAIKSLVEMGNKSLKYFNPQALSNMVWAMACLGQKDEIFLSRLGWELANTTKNVRPQALSLTLWALTRLEIYDTVMYTIIANRFFNNSNKIYSQGVSNSLWALANANIVPKNPKVFETTLISIQEQKLSAQGTIDDPIASCFDLGAQHLMSQPFQHTPQGISNILLSFVKVGVRHPKLFQAIAAHLVGQAGCDPSEIRGLDHFFGQGISNMAWAFAKHAQIGSDSLSPNKSKLYSGRLAVYKISSMDIGEGLQQRLFAGFAKSVLRLHGKLSGLSPQGLSNMVWSFALLGYKHDAFLDAAQIQALEKVKTFLHDNHNDEMTTFTTQGISNFLWGLASLSQPLIPGLMDALSIALVEQCKDPISGEITISSIADEFFHRPGLASLAWACAVHNQYPPEIIKIIYMGMLGVGCEEPLDPSYLTESVYKDDGIDGGMTISLLYLQISMELDDGNVGMISLPKNFPQTWVKNSDSNNNIDNNNNSNNNSHSINEMKISSSKVQKEVSLALDRIGFDHAEEFVIDLSMLVNEFGINNIPEGSFEVFSIDIANVHKKIAIEVDGPAHFVASLNDIENVTNPLQNELESTPHTVDVENPLEYGLDIWNRKELNGSTMLKHRILEKLGWKVISIKVWDWYELDNDSDKEDAFCRSLFGL